MAGYYDPNKDYSKAIEAAKAAGQDTTKLEQERANKIADKYGGKEPNMYGSDKTYSQLSGSNASKGNQSVIDKAIAISNFGNSAATNQQSQQEAIWKMPEYEGSKWDSKLDSVAKKLLGMNYSDWTEGDQYADLADRYAQQGKLSMQDTIGQIAGRTGGMASSYAVSAAQQKNNNWMAKLEEAARAMYEGERSDLMDQAEMLRQYANDDYNRYLSQADLLSGDRSFQYGAWRDSVEDQRYEQSTDLAAAQKKADTLASYGIFSGYKELGYTDAQIALMKAAYDSQQAAKAAGNGGGDGSAEQDYDGLFRAAQSSGNPQSFIANNYKKYGFISATGLYNDYKSWANEGAGAGMQADYFRATMQSIVAQLSAGKEEAAESNINSVWDRLSNEQRSQLQTLLERYGLSVE